MALGIEVMIKFKNIGNIAYYKRSILYHTLSITSAIILDALIFALGGFGVSEIGTCSLNNFFAQIVEYIPRIVFMICMIYITIFLYRNATKRYSKMFINYYFIIFFVILA